MEFQQVFAAVVVVALALIGRCRWTYAGNDGGEAIGKEQAMMMDDASKGEVRTEVNAANAKWVRGADEPYASVGAFRKSLWNRGTSALFLLLQIKNKHY